jgi:hypothetical protein
VAAKNNAYFSVGLRGRIKTGFENISDTLLLKQLMLFFVKTFYI